MKQNYNKFSKQEHNLAEELKQETTAMDEVTITRVDSEPEEIVKPSKAKVVNCIGLNIREKATKDSDVICVVRTDDILIVGQALGEWIEVYTKDGSEIEGYVMREFIQVIEG